MTKQWLINWNPFFILCMSGKYQTTHMKIISPELYLDFEFENRVLISYKLYYLDFEFECCGKLKIHVLFMLCFSTCTSFCHQCIYFCVCQTKHCESQSIDKRKFINLEKRKRKKKKCVISLQLL